MRLRSKTKFRIMLVSAFVGVIAWCISSSIEPAPDSGPWPWPLRMRTHFRWVRHVQVTENSKGEIQKLIVIRDTKTGQTRSDDGFDGTRVKEDGTEETTKSTFTTLRESEEQSGRMIRLGIFIAGIFVSFLACWFLSWTGLTTISALSRKR